MLTEHARGIFKQIQNNPPQSDGFMLDHYIKSRL